MDNMTNETFSNATMLRMAFFQKNNDIFSKGKLSLVIQFTRMAKGRAFPLRAEDFQTDSKGQVTGIGGGNLKKILKEHGITKQLTSEGGRMRAFGHFYLDKEKDHVVDLFQEGDDLRYMLRTPNHGTGNLIANLASRPVRGRQRHHR